MKSAFGSPNFRSMVVSGFPVAAWVLAAVPFGTVACRGVFAEELPAEPSAPVYSMDDEVRAYHILLATEAEAIEAQREILEAGGTIDAFRKVCRVKSKDPTTKPLGGDLNYFTLRSGFDRAFAEAAFDLKPGQMSNPVKTSFGWHLIYVTDRRPKARPKPPPKPETPAKEQPVAQPSAPTPAAPVARTNPARLSAGPGGSVRVALMTVKSLRSQPSQFTYAPDQAIEVLVTVVNEGDKDRQFFVPQLLPLGMRVTPFGETQAVAADFSSMPEPESFIRALKPYEAVGLSVNVDEYFKKLETRRYRVTWDVSTFLGNLESRFPKVKDVDGYGPLAEELRKQRVATEVIVRDTYNRASRSREIVASVFENFRPEKRYTASILLQGQEKPIVIALDFRSQFAAARHFANLLLEGFYDNLNFFEIQPGDFVLGGCPLRTGTGAPSGFLPILRNTAKLEHKRGTVSFVTRNVRTQGPVEGGQVGSIFMVCLKPHPEWDEEHVPFGEVVSGLEVLDGLKAPVSFSQLWLSAEEGEATKPPAPATPPDLANPEAVIKTSKGDLVVELFEDVTRNTVVNFVRLALDGFYDKVASGEGKQKFFFFLKDEKTGKPLAIQTGSPNNDFDGSPGYFVRTEKSGRPCARGALVMAVQTDAEANRFVPDTAGSQYLILLSDIEPWNYQEGLTVFGQVRKGLEVLDKLQEGDVVEKVEITRKKNHSYTPAKLPLR
ncbi:MAG: peptidylprolyl isomerase [Planctomycetota bacterium]